MGVEHVALGSDYDGTVAVPFDTTGLVYITESLIRAGLSPEEISKLTTRVEHVYGCFDRFRCRTDYGRKRATSSFENVATCIKKKKRSSHPMHHVPLGTKSGLGEHELALQVPIEVQ